MSTQMLKVYGCNVRKWVEIECKAYNSDGLGDCCSLVLQGALALASNITNAFGRKRSDGLDTTLVTVGCRLN
jgi:hypothetical protein